MRLSSLAPPAALAAASFALFGCKSDPFHAATRATDQRDAGSVHVTVMAVAPWSHYVDALQPRFQLTADEARNLVIRDTRQEIESRQKSMSTSLSAVENPTATSQPTGPEPLKAGNFAAVPPGIEGPDAMMEYWTANGLYQEVQILNRVVRDAVIPKGFRPYLVRLQISLIPRRRHQPYDAYTTLSFFAPNEAYGKGGAATSVELAHLPETSLRDTGPGARSTGGTGPVVLPLLVTDNLESSLKHRSSQDIQRLALSLLALPGSFAGKLSTDLFANEFQGQVAGRDLNALLTVARMSQNTLRVRIGAMAESTADYAMVPRNHNVTLLLMVPQEEPGQVELVARTTLVDTETGVELPDSSEEDVTRLLAAVGARYGIESLGREGLGELFRFAQVNDQRGFRARLAERMGPAHRAVRLSQSLWIELVGLMGGSQFAAARFELPGHGEAQNLPPGFYDQTLVVIDRGTSVCETLVRHAAFPEGARVQASVALEFAGRPVSLPAEAVHVDMESQSVRLVFNSLAALGLGVPASQPGNLRVSLRVGDDTHWFTALYLAPQAGTPQPAPAVTAQPLVPPAAPAVPPAAPPK